MTKGIFYFLLLFVIWVFEGLGFGYIRVMSEHSWSNGEA